MKTFLAVLIFLTVVVTTMVAAAEPVLMYKVSIIKTYDHKLYGGFGNSAGSLGCSSDLFISPYSSIKFGCDETTEFKEKKLLYVFGEKRKYFACPSAEFTLKCLPCDECFIKDSELRKLELPY